MVLLLLALVLLFTFCAGPLVEPLKPLETFNLVAIL